MCICLRVSITVPGFCFCARLCARACVCLCACPCVCLCVCLCARLWDWRCGQLASTLRARARTTHTNTQTHKHTHTHTRTDTRERMRRRKHAHARAGRALSWHRRSSPLLACVLLNKEKEAWKANLAWAKHGTKTHLRCAAPRASQRGLRLGAAGSRRRPLGSLRAFQKAALPQLRGLLDCAPSAEIVIRLRPTSSCRALRLQGAAARP